MSGRDSDFISHIMLAAARLEEIVEAGRDRFDSSWLIRAAAERQLEIIGEAAGKLSQHLIAQRPDLPLAKASAMRNFIAHDYDDIDHKLVWDTIAASVPDLARALAPLADEPRRRRGPGIDGGNGVDHLDGGPDTDTCTRGDTTAQCENQAGTG